MPTAPLLEALVDGAGVLLVPLAVPLDTLDVLLESIAVKIKLIKENI